MKVLITGASGFIGGFLMPALRDAGHEVRAASRSCLEQEEIECVVAPELGPDADWSRALIGVDTVVHLAGLAHAPSKKGDVNVERIYRRINAEGSRVLAEQCAGGGVKHFIFLSSCHALAAASDEVLTERTVPQPASPYGRSKLAAENAVTAILNKSDCAWTILRPPLVYGPGNKANFGLLVKLVKSGLPLPLASVRNRRSFIYIENLVDLIVACLGNSKAFGKTFLPSDGDDLSTAKLIEKIVRAEDGNLTPGCKIGGCAARRARFFPFPKSLLKVMGLLPGLGALRKLTSSLYVDSEPTRRELGWLPPFTMQEGLKRTFREGEK